MVNARYIITLLIILLCHSLKAQEQHLIDSLSARLQENRPDGQAGLHDTDRVKALNALAWELKYANPDSAIILSSQALSIAEAFTWQPGIADCFNKLGTFNWVKGDYPKALENFFKALKMDEELNRKSDVAAHLSNIGLVYWNQGEYPEALNYFFKALKMDEELGKKTVVASILGNIGNVYNKLGDYPKALKHYFRALKMDEDLDRKTSIAITLGNIGGVYHTQGDYPKALEYFLEALKIDEELGNKNGIARHLGNIGIVYYAQENYPKTLEYYFKALNVNEELGRKNGIAIILGNIGTLYTETGEFEKAEKTLQKALSLSKEIGAKEYLRYQYEFLSTLYDTTGRPAQAFEAYKLYIIYRDSIANEENTKAQTRTEMKYEYEKAELIAEQEKNEKQRILNEKLKRRDNLQYSVILLGLLVLGTLVLGLGKLALPPRMAEGIIFFSFLILFEFLLVLADPYIDGWSNGAPGVKLLFNAGIAALIFPLHSLFESRLKGKLVKR